jgi:hypothetical protein
MMEVASTEVRLDLLKTFKLSRKASETMAEFTARVVHKAHKCDEGIWDDLQEPTQIWVNGWMTAEENGAELSLLEEESAEAADEESEAVEAGESEENEPASSDKLGKKKASKDTKMSKG